jgi:hypothetical protein
MKDDYVPRAPKDPSWIDGGAHAAHPSQWRRKYF